MAAPKKETLDALRQQLQTALANDAAKTAQIEALAHRVSILEDRIAMAVNQQRQQRYA